MKIPGRVHVTAEIFRLAEVSFRLHVRTDAKYSGIRVSNQ